MFNSQTQICMVDNDRFVGHPVQKMKTRFSSVTRRSVALAMVAVSILPIGCASRGGILGVDCCADILSGAIPRPPGAKVCEWHTAQIKNAAADQTVLYRADFVGASTTLSPGAAERMGRNAASGLLAIQPTVIEPSGDIDLDAQRVDAVARELAGRGIDQPVIQLAIPAALGLSGPQAERVAGGFGNIRGSNATVGAPISQPAGLGGQTGAFGGGAFGGGLPGGIF